MEKKNSTRNWTLEETNLFCSILVDPLINFMVTLERKALKKSSTKEVFEAILEELDKALDEEPFKSSTIRREKGKLQVDVKKLQVKYNNIKQQSRKLKDKKRNGSGLAAADDPEWFKIVNPVLADTNQGFNAICSTPGDTSLNDLFDPPRDSDDSEREYDERQREDNFEESEDEGEETEEPEQPVRRKVVAKPHEKRSAARSLLQAINQLAMGVNKLADISAKRLKVEERDRQSMLEFRREEAEKNRKQEYFLFFSPIHSNSPEDTIPLFPLLHY